jgi:Protein of unknown function (DUF1559)
MRRTRMAVSILALVLLAATLVTSADSAGRSFAEARNRVASRARMRKLWKAVDHYVAAANFDWPTNVADKDGRQLLSWGVRLLPYFGEKALYEKFKLGEPWDGRNNLALLEEMPQVFESPRVAVRRRATRPTRSSTAPVPSTSPARRRTTSATPPTARPTPFSPSSRARRSHGRRRPICLTTRRSRSPTSARHTAASPCASGATARSASST